MSEQQATGPSIGSSSAKIALGTMTSRVTGLIRAMVLVSVIGAVGAADAFAVANFVPQNIFHIISVGVLTAVIVPQIVKATKQADNGEQFISKLFTLAGTILIVITLLAMALAPWLVRVSADADADSLALATAFAYWCLPQVFFYGMFAIVGETLNARGIYGPYAWAPIMNNIVSIAGFVVILAIWGGPHKYVGEWTTPMVYALGGVATGAIVVQFLTLLLFWKRTGLHLRLDFKWRGYGLGHMGKLASMTMIMAVAGVVVGTVQTRVAMWATGHDPSVAVLQYAWLIYLLPYSIIVISIGTPYFTRISDAAHEGRTDLVVADIRACVRTVGILIVGALAVLCAAIIPATRVFTSSASEAHAAALVLACYLTALVPMAVMFIIQRTFYAYDDTKTPLFFTLIQLGITLVLTFAAAWLEDSGHLDVKYLAAAIALGQSIASIIQTVIAVFLLRRKIGSLQTLTWLSSLGRFVLAGVPAAFAGWGVFQLLGGGYGWVTINPILAIVGAGIIAIATLIVYVLLLFLLRAPELQVALRMLPGRK